MSEKEKQMVEKWAKLPPRLQEKLLDQATGAVMAMDAMSREEAANGNGMARPAEDAGGDRGATG